ncbi:MAG: serine/threonine-protein phosphatase [Frankiales bacterium]|nr:serine/threonine-protein phosphatase [Frankiales bacterium]
MTTVRSLANLLREAQQNSPEDVVANLVAGARQLGGTDLVLYLIDYEQQILQPTPDRLEHGGVVRPASVLGTMAGRCFSTQTLLEAAGDDGLQVWVPVTERAERLGVLAMTVTSLDDDDRVYAEELGLLAALLVMAASPYTDRYHLLRRRTDLSLAAEMQWSLLPPLAFSCHGTTVAGLLEPAYEVGGDCFDYALNGDTLSLAVFDAMGHGLPASVISSLVVGAYRHSRRTQVPLADLFATMDHAVAGLMGDTFVTALAAELDVRSGRFCWTSAGHHRPVVIRGGRVLAESEQVPSLPLGLSLVAQGEITQPAELSLEPGDRVLLYTDGVVEGRSPAGEEFGLEHLLDLLVRESASGLLAGEVLRRLVHNCLEFQGGQLRDDATLLLLEWSGPTAAVAPQQLP